MWTQLQGWEKIFILTILAGSIVDIFQFTWIVKKAWSSMKHHIRESVKKELYTEMIQLNTKIEQNPEIFLGLGEKK